MGLEGSCKIYMGIFVLLVFKVILGSSGCICLRMTCNSKKTGYRVERSEIWDLLVVVTCIWGTFDLLSKWHPDENFGRRVKRIEIWNSKLLVKCISCSFDRLVLKVTLR